VALYYTKEGASKVEEDPILAQLSDEEKARVKQLKALIGTLPAEQVHKMLGELETSEAQAPDDKKAMLTAIKQLAQQRLKELEGGQQ
jgi:hypothetical protein